MFRALVRLSFVAGVLAAVSAAFGEQPAEEQKAVAALEKCKAEIAVDSKAPGKPAIAVAQGVGPGSEFTDAVLVHLKSLPNLREVIVGDASKITDAGLENFKGLSKLEGIQLFSCGKVTDAGLAHFEGLANLKRLDINGAKITDAGLVHLQKLTNLQTLRLTDSKITDAGIAHLQKLTKLKSLSLGNEITDKGLAQLAGLSQLETLDVSLCKKVTPKAVADLKKSLPKLKTVHAPK